MRVCVCVRARVRPRMRVRARVVARVDVHSPGAEQIAQCRLPRATALARLSDLVSPFIRIVDTPRKLPGK